MGRVQHSDDDSNESASVPKKKRRSEVASSGAKVAEKTDSPQLAKGVEPPFFSPPPLPMPIMTGAVLAAGVPDWLSDVVPPTGIFGMTGLSSMVGASAGKVAGLGFGQGGVGFDMAPASDDPKVETTRMDFSKPKDVDSTAVAVHKELVPLLMTADHKKLLAEESGANVEWADAEAKVLLSGSAEQILRAQRLLARVTTHSRWGQSADKVRRCIKPRKAESVLCRLSAMGTLPAVRKTLNAAHPLISFGKGPENSVILPNPYRVLSRQHCVLEFDEERGAVYIFDCSTNGTFLNSRRLPPKQNGKILLSHGDELMFKDPADGKHEFGYIVNLSEIAVKAETKWDAPRRLLAPEEITQRDYVR